MYTIVLGSANILDLHSKPGAADNYGDVRDPVCVKEKIGLAEVTEKLFPRIKTGVRYWPYLLVARDLSDQAPRRIVPALKLLKRAQPRERQRLGPGVYSSFSRYQSMFRDIENGPDNALRRFVQDRRRRYTGSFQIFEENEAAWRKALVTSLSDGAKVFAAILKKENQHRDAPRDDEVSLTVVERAISRALESEAVPHELWHGAACYAFLQCMYGLEASDEIEAPIKAADWAQHLLDAIQQTRQPAAKRFRRYEGAIRASKMKPPWARIHQRLRKNTRRVFSDVRFHTFANLYLLPSPRGFGNGY